MSLNMGGGISLWVTPHGTCRTLQTIKTTCTQEGDTVGVQIMSDGRCVIISGRSGCVVGCVRNAQAKIQGAALPLTLRYTPAARWISSQSSSKFLLAEHRNLLGNSTQNCSRDEPVSTSYPVPLTPEATRYRSKLRSFSDHAMALKK